MVIHVFEALVGCHDILILGKSPIKWRQRPDMTIVVDWDVKYQSKQTKIEPPHDKTNNLHMRKQRRRSASG